MNTSVVFQQMSRLNQLLWLTFYELQDLDRREHKNTLDRDRVRSAFDEIPAECRNIHPYSPTLVKKLAKYNYKINPTRGHRSELNHRFNHVNQYFNRSLGEYKLACQRYRIPTVLDDIRPNSHDKTNLTQELLLDLATQGSFSLDYEGCECVILSATHQKIDFYFAPRANIFQDPLHGHAVFDYDHQTIYFRDYGQSRSEAYKLQKQFMTPSQIYT